MGEEVKERRSFLNLILAFLSAISALIIGLPLIRFTFPPEGVIKMRGRKTQVGKVREIPEGGSKTVLFENSPVLLINYGGEFRALSAICSHMGCFLRWDPQSGQIKCPCHYASFDIEGKVISGPPPRPLKSFKIEISDERIFILKD